MVLPNTKAATNIDLTMNKSFHADKSLEKQSFHTRSVKNPLRISVFLVDTQTSDTQNKGTSGIQTFIQDCQFCAHGRIFFENFMCDIYLRVSVVEAILC